MSKRCKERGIWDKYSWSSRQCTKNATRDGYCGIHHPDAVKRRRDKQNATYAAKQKMWDLKEFDSRAGNRCRKLGIQPEEICLPTPN